MSTPSSSAALPTTGADACRLGDDTVSRLREEHFRRKLRKVLGLRRGMSDSAMLAEAHRRLQQALSASSLPGRQIAPQVVAVLRRFEGAALTLQQAVLLSSELDALTAPKGGLQEPTNQVAAGLHAHGQSGAVALSEPLEALRHSRPTALPSALDCRGTDTP